MEALLFLEEWVCVVGQVLAPGAVGKVVICNRAGARLDLSAFAEKAQHGRLHTASLRCARSRANALRCSKTLPAFLVRTSSLRCARSRANALRCSKTLPAFLSVARDALLQAYAPFASRPADASRFRTVAAGKPRVLRIYQQ